MEKLYRGPYVDAYCQVWFHLAKLFQRRRLNQRLSRACIVHLVIKKNNWSRTCLTLDPMGKMFQNASSLKTNCPGMIIGRSSVVYADRKSKMAATTGHNINTGPYGENTEIYSSLKL
jgi:hypothetical protein